MDDVTEKLRFYEVGTAIDQPREATLDGIARWHDEQAEYYSGGIFVEGVNLEMTPKSERRNRADYRKLLKFYKAELAFHTEAAAVIRRAMLRVVA